MTPHDTLVEAALECAYGDGDPAPIVQAMRRDPAARAAVRGALETLRTAARATRPDAQAQGLAILEGLLREAERAEPLAAPAPGDRRPGSVPPNAALRRARIQWFGLAALAAAAAVLLALRLRTAPTDDDTSSPLVDARGDLTVAALEALAQDALPTGLGFAGARLRPAARGYLLGLARDAQLAAMAQGGDRARALALDAVARLSEGLTPQLETAAPDRVALGCVALVDDGAGRRAECEHGLTLYRLKRDLGTPAGDRRVRTPEALAALRWVAGTGVADVKAELFVASGPIAQGERDALSAVLTSIGRVLEAGTE